MLLDGLMRLHFIRGASQRKAFQSILTIGPCNQSLENFRRLFPNLVDLFGALNGISPAGPLRMETEKCTYILRADVALAFLKPCCCRGFQSLISCMEVFLSRSAKSQMLFRLLWLMQLRRKFDIAYMICRSGSKIY